MKDQVELQVWLHNLITECELQPEKAKLIYKLAHHSDIFNVEDYSLDIHLELEDVIETLNFIDNL